MAEVYVSTDVEADGPIPGPHSMLSFASATYRADKTLLGPFEANLELLPGAQGDPKTMEWWRGQPDAWAACRANTRDPAVVMPEYVRWLKALPGKPVFVAYPAAYDFMFVYWYLIRFAGESPFSHSALDLKTYTMASAIAENARKSEPPRPRFGDNQLSLPNDLAVQRAQVGQQLAVVLINE